MALEFPAMATGNWGSFDHASVETDLLRHKYAAVSVTSLPPLSDVSDMGRVRRRWRCRSTMTPTQITRQALLNARTDHAGDALRRNTTTPHRLSSSSLGSRRASSRVQIPTPEFRALPSRSRGTPPPVAGILEVRVLRCVDLVHPDAHPALGGANIRRPVCVVSLGSVHKALNPPAILQAAGKMPDQFWGSDNANMIFDIPVEPSTSSLDGELKVAVHLPQPHADVATIGTATLALNSQHW